MSQGNQGNSQDETVDEIVVTGKSRTSAEPRLVIDFGGGGSNVPPVDFTDLLPERLRAMIVKRTDFDAAGAFSSHRRAILRAVLNRLSDHPRYAAKVAEMLAKGADVNIRYATTADFQNPQIGDVDGVVQREGSGPIREGETVTIILRETRGGVPVSDKAFATAFLHELLHLLGDNALDTLLHNSDLDAHVLDELFGKNFDFDLPLPPSADFLSSAPNGGTVTAGSAPAILSGSSASDVLHASMAAGAAFPGAGNDEVHVRVGSQPIVIADDSGIDTLVIEGNAVIDDLVIMQASDRDDTVVMVRGTPLVYIKNVSSGGAFEYVEVGNIRYPLSLIPTVQNVSPNQIDVHQDVFGSFFGGFIVSAATSDNNSDSLAYEIKAISGDFANADWRVDKATGAISCFMTKPDEPGSKITELTVRSSDGVSTTDIKVTIRWAHSGETTPEL